MLPALLDSLAPLECRIWYADGAYRLYLEPGQDWRTPTESLAEVIRGRADIQLAPYDAPWESEAQKKTEMLRHIRSQYGDGWVLFLDTDERVECPDPIGFVEWCESRLHGKEWAYVNIWRPDQAWALDGFYLPRLLLNRSGVSFSPPRDFEVTLNGERIAWINPLRVPPEQAHRYSVLPPGLLRLRHEHGQRPDARHNQNGRYAQRRRAETGTP